MGHRPAVKRLCSGKQMKNSRGPPGPPSKTRISRLPADQNLNSGREPRIAHAQNHIRQPLRHILYHLHLVSPTESFWYSKLVLFFSSVEDQTRELTFRWYLGATLFKMCLSLNPSITITASRCLYQGSEPERTRRGYPTSAAYLGSPKCSPGCDVRLA